MELDFKEIGKRIKTIRSKALLEQDQFGKIFDVGNQTISNWETGKKKIDMKYLVAIARFGRVSIDYLITGIEPSVKLIEEIASKDNAINELLVKYGELKRSVDKDINNHASERSN